MQDFVPGIIAETLKLHNKSTAALGNSDTSLEYVLGTQNREVVEIAMNGRGIVRYGDVGKDMLRKAPDYPYGIQIDFDRVQSKFKSLLPLADFIAIDLGETVRADSYSSYTFKWRASQLRMKALQDTGLYITKLIKSSPKDTTFIITALTPPGTSKEGLAASMEQMTPMLIHGPGFKAGSLVSNTTRRDGFISILDIAPTVLNTLGIDKPPALSGSPMHMGTSSITPESLNSFNQNAIEVKGDRRAAISAFIYIQIAIYLLAALILVNSGC